MKGERGKVKGVEKDKGRKGKERKDRKGRKTDIQGKKVGTGATTYNLFRKYLNQVPRPNTVTILRRLFYINSYFLTQG